MDARGDWCVRGRSYKLVWAKDLKILRANVHAPVMHLVEYACGGKPGHAESRQNALDFSAMRYVRPLDNRRHERELNAKQATKNFAIINGFERWTQPIEVEDGCAHQNAGVITPLV